MAHAEIAEVFGAQWPRLVATLRADLGDLDFAEDAAQQAFLQASERWEADGIPDTPGAWLLTVARRWAIDQVRRDVRWAQREDDVRAIISRPQRDRGAIDDDLLAMVFGCCHRALDESARVALTLRYVVGLPTASIARAFLIPEATMAKRLVRAKKKIAATRVPFEIPDRERLSDSLHDVLKVVYVIFTQGHAAPAEQLIRGDLCEEARWLASCMCDLLPDEPETWGLAALLAFTEARRPARIDEAGEVVLLSEQNRALWDARAIENGRRLLGCALQQRRVGTYQLQAAIAAAHATAPTFGDTDWSTIQRLYAVLARVEPSPIVELNGAVAASFADGPDAGLRLLEPIADALESYHYFHLARADMLANAGRLDQARFAFDRALELCDSDAERRAIARVASKALAATM
ncbi:sigma-70 family RNA polymerase sigma factor [Microbacterium sp. NPDC076911]|uniref:RNA polymerase sigma factor n=1 Tax=Microbacterium sp. NPDC076911 TaxID=3154958 RepID=UPI003422F5F9